METFGLNFVVNTLGVGALGGLRGSIDSLTGSVNNLNQSFDKSQFSMMGFLQGAARIVGASLPVLLFKQVISAGSDLNGMMTQLTVAMNGNEKAAQDMYYRMKEAVEWLPISSAEALRAYTNLKMSGIDALTQLGTYTTKLGDETKQVPVNIMTLAQSIAVKSRQPFDSVMYAFQAALRGNTMLLRMRLGPAGADIGRMIASGGIDGFKQLYAYMEKQKLVGLAIEQAKTLPAMIVGFKDKISDLMKAIAGFASNPEGLYARFSKAVEKSYDVFKTWMDDTPRLERLGQVIGDALTPIITVVEKALYWMTKLAVWTAEFALKYPMAVKVAIWAPVVLALGLVNLLASALMWVGGHIMTWMATSIAFKLLAATGLTAKLTAAIGTLKASLTGMGAGGAVTLMERIARIANFIFGIKEYLAGAAFWVTALVMGFAKIINFGALWEGMKDGFMLAFSQLAPMIGIIQTIGSEIWKAGSLVSGWIDKFLEVLGMSTEMKNVWYQIGTVFGVIAGVVGGVLYAAFAAVLTVVKIILAVVRVVFNLIGAIAGMLGYVGLSTRGLTGAQTYGQGSMGATIGAAGLAAQEQFSVDSGMSRAYAPTGVVGGRSLKVDNMNVTVQGGPEVSSERSAAFWDAIDRRGQESFAQEYGDEVGYQGAY